MAGPFPQDFIESVRNAGDIVRLVGDYVPLKAAVRFVLRRAGSGIWA